MATVFIYTLSTCGHCKRTKEFFAEQGVDYDYVDVDKLQGPERQETIDKVKDINPRCSFPTVVIGDNVIVGFKQDEIKDALKEAGRI
ncbi:MAG: glutaredoxin family protein [Desulfatibacillaceae bacterium]